MIRIQQLRLPLGSRGQLEEAIGKRLGLKGTGVINYHIIKEALDARKDQLQWVYTIDVEVGSKDEQRLLRRQDPLLSMPKIQIYEPPLKGSIKLKHRPLVIGAGPAGLFAAMVLAEQGYKPILLERGAPVEKRVASVERFWQTGDLDPESNVQFGEGGAGTFSDGKLATQIRDVRINLVLQAFIAAGAPPEIAYQAAPHLGTDKLQKMMPQIRQRLLDAGAEIRYQTKVKKLLIIDNLCRGVYLEDDEFVAAEAVILAIGHSARDTFTMLAEQGVPMQAKSFSIGVRIEQSQTSIDQGQYGAMAGHSELGAAAYKLVYHTTSKRTVYSFCMCPGGVVVGAASESGRLVTNGMSYAARAGQNANAALLVDVHPHDYGHHPLDGVRFQQHWEETAFNLGGGAYRAPLQRVDDFLQEKSGKEPGLVQPSYLPGVSLADLHKTLPSFVSLALTEALPSLNRKLAGFADADALLTGIESRSSSPVRILRDAEGESAISGLFPAGEGAGYAGGIISAAVDGIHAAEAVIRRFCPDDRYL